MAGNSPTGIAKFTSVRCAIKVAGTGFYTYPDAVAVCGEPQFEDRELDTLVNPTLIIEVLSKSTEAYDRGAKLEFYRALDSLTQILLIAQDAVREALLLWEARERSHAEILAAVDRAEASLAKRLGNQITRESMESLADEVSRRGPARLSAEERSHR
ncbi:MAG TPA: Uma2 family endonuclease [Blastocatellia bacterium]|nr:Uma2 family endonuclease [Blastocatellia bacterium]